MTMELTEAEIKLIRSALRQVHGIGSTNPQQQAARRVLLARVIAEIEKAKP